MRALSRSHPIRTLVRSNAAEASRVARQALANGLRPKRPESAELSRLPEFDPYAADVVADPWGAYRALHAGGRLHRCRRRKIWIVSRYEDVRAAARSHETLSSGEGVTLYRVPLPMMLTTDRPAHARLRRIVTGHFTAQAVGRQREVAAAIAAEAVEAMLAEGGGDLATRLAMPLPVAVIAELLGVPGGDLPAFRRWSDQIVQGFALLHPLAIHRAAVPLNAIVRLDRYFARTIDRRRRAPGDDLISALLASSEEGQLSDQELFWFCLLLLVAGNETTTNLIGVMALALANYPDQYSRLRERPELVGQAIEESLRYVSPLQGLFRTTLKDHRIGELAIPTGERVLLLFGAANRDPLQYPEPDSFRVDREASDHLAFGSGIHFCLGAHLARLEAAAVLETLIERVERIELAGRPEWLGNPTLRGLQRLPVRLVPAA